jgi:flagellar hook-length control protein FliK
LLNNISLGLPTAGVTELKSQDRELTKDLVKELKGNFDSKLNEKMRPNPDNRNQAISSKESLAAKPFFEKNEKLQRFKPSDRSDRKSAVKQESKDETSTGQAALGLPTKKSQRAREEEIQKFMDSFESEFGIPSTRIVEAFSQLNTEKLEASPEESADSFIAQLRLSGEDESKAKAMYMSMLGQLQMIDQKSNVPYVVTVDQQNLQSAVQPDRLLSQQDRKLHLQNTLDQMNQRFWMKGAAYDSQALGPQNPAALQKSMLESDGLNSAGSQPQNLELQSDPSLDTALAAGLGGELMQDQKALPGQDAVNADRLIEQKVAQLKAMDPSMTPQQAQQLIKEMKSEQLERNRMKWSEASLASAVPEAQAKSAVQGPEALMPAVSSDLGGKDFAQQFANQQDSQGSFQGQSESGGSSLGPNSERLKPSLKPEFDSTMAELGAGSAGLSRSGAHHVGATASVAAAAGAPVESKEMNMQQVMNQAQYLIKKGGGEMKVKLSPEGMGDLHLKILVQDGKVSMQMSADNPQAKKLLEENVSDLKHSLASHKLSVESIKIDTVNSANTDNNSQNSKDAMNSNQQQERQGDRQFWNRFQENFGNRGQRESGALDMPNLRGYGRKQDPLQPLDPSVSSKTKRTDGRGQGLDLVA